MQVNHTMTQLITERETLRAEIERLRADNERLRVALREIASIPTCPGAERERLIHVARAALGEER